MGVFNSLAGMVHVSLTSADITSALWNINKAGISTESVVILNELTVNFVISYRNLSFLRGMVNRSGDKLRILKYDGIFWDVLQLRKRPILLTSVVMFCSLLLFMPGRVFFVSVEGNHTVPAKQILEAAESAGIYFGSSRRDVRSEKVKNSLLDTIPQLQWAGVNTYGSTAIISVRERRVKPPVENAYSVTRIVASRDGVIMSCTATKGTSLCTEGQAVKKGETLISGYVDSGRSITAMQAEGEIFARTRHDLLVRTPSITVTRGNRQRQKTNYSLFIGKKRINFTKGSGIYDSTCVKMYTEYYLTLPGGFSLPVVLVKEIICEYETLTQQRNADRLRQQLADYAKDYLSEQTISLTIHDIREELTEGEELYSLHGEYSCSEMIGREQSEEIGDFHGKTN